MNNDFSDSGLFETKVENSILYVKCKVCKAESSFNLIFAQEKVNFKCKCGNKISFPIENRKI